MAKDVTQDAAKSYVEQCFKNVSSVIHSKPLTRATGLALKELLELIHDELMVGGIDEQPLSAWTDDVRAFIKRDEVKQAIASLYLDPDYRLLPHTVAEACGRIAAANTLPDDFSWRGVGRAVRKRRLH